MRAAIAHAPLTGCDRCDRFLWALPQTELDLGELFAWNARMREVVERHQPPAFHPSVDGPAGDLQEPCSLCRRHERRHRSRRLPRI